MQQRKQVHEFRFFEKLLMNIIFRNNYDFHNIIILIPLFLSFNRRNVLGRLHQKPMINGDWLKKIHILINSH